MSAASGFLQSKTLWPSLQRKPRSLTTVTAQGSAGHRPVARTQGCDRGCASAGCCSKPNRAGSATCPAASARRSPSWRGRQDRAGSTRDWTGVPTRAAVTSTVAEQTLSWWGNREAGQSWHTAPASRGVPSRHAAISEQLEQVAPNREKATGIRPEGKGDWHVMGGGNRGPERRGNKQDPK